MRWRASVPRYAPAIPRRRSACRWAKASAARARPCPTSTTSASRRAGSDRPQLRLFLAPQGRSLARRRRGGVFRGHHRRGNNRLRIRRARELIEHLGYDAAQENAIADAVIEQGAGLKAANYSYSTTLPSGFPVLVSFGRKSRPLKRARRLSEQKRFCFFFPSGRTTATARRRNGSTTRKWARGICSPRAA